MRWEKLFADLDARFGALQDAEMMAELADRARVAAGEITMVQRCIGSIGQNVRVRVVTGSVLAGVIDDVGPNWLLLSGTGPGDILVVLPAITAIEGLKAATGAPLSAVARRIDARIALRGIARDRAAVVLTTAGMPSAQTPAQGNEITGTIDRVGADFIELARHPVWEPRRAHAVRSMVTVPLQAIVSVRSRPTG